LALGSKIVGQFPTEALNFLRVFGGQRLNGFNGVVGGFVVNDDYFGNNRALFEPAKVF